MHEMNRQGSRTNQSIKESPFDPFLDGFLAAVGELGGGYSFQSHGAGIARRLEVDPAFIEALTINARRRSLIEPFYPSSHRSTVRWRVSARGKQFLAALNSPGPE
jgi:hypothetical protein